MDIRKASKLVCIGRNYAAHARELNNPIPTSPFFFLKPASSLVFGPKYKLEIPDGVIVHHEIELALIIKNRLKDVGPDSVMENIAGYALAIDFTARNVQDAAKKKAYPWAFSKGFDTFAPLSETISAETVKDPNNLLLKLSINNTIKQDASTSLMLTKIPQMVSIISSIMTLEQNDIVLTGTPAGVGPVKVGDSVDCSLEQDGQKLLGFSVDAVDRNGIYKFQGENGVI